MISWQSSILRKRTSGASVGEYELQNSVSFWRSAVGVGRPYVVVICSKMSIVFHRWIPSREVGVRGELECVVNGFVEHIIACSLDVQVREPVVSTKYEISVDLRLGDAIESRDGNICWVARCIKLGISIDIKNGDSCPIIYRLLSGIGR